MHECVLLDRQAAEAWRGRGATRPISSLARKRSNKGHTAVIAGWANPKVSENAIAALQEEAARARARRRAAGCCCLGLRLAWAWSPVRDPVAGRQSAAGSVHACNAMQCNAGATIRSTNKELDRSAAASPGRALSSL